MKRLVSFLAVLGGCGGPEEPPTYPGPALAILGTGVSRFVPIGDQAILPMIRGHNPGGQHIWASVLARYVDHRDPSIRIGLTRVDTGEVVGGWEWRFDLDPLDPAHLPPPSDPPTLPVATEGWSDVLGLPAFVTNLPRANRALVKMRVDITDRHGRTCADEKVFFTYLPPFRRFSPDSVGELGPAP